MTVVCMCELRELGCDSMASLPLHTITQRLNPLLFDAVIMVHYGSALAEWVSLR